MPHTKSAIWRNQLLSLLALATFALLSVTAAIAQDVEEGSAAAPDPSSLSVNWWDYFSNDTAQASKNLAQLQQNLKPHIKQYSEQIAAIDSAGKSWLSSLSTTDSATEKMEAIAEPWSVTQLLDISQRQWQMQQAMLLEKSAQSESSANVDALERRQSVLRTSYEDSEAGTPPRLLSGLLVIAGRLNLEAARNKDEIMQASLSSNQSTLSTLKTSVQSAGRHIYLSEAEIAQWQRQLPAAKKAFDKLAENAVLGQADSFAQLPNADAVISRLQQQISELSTQMLWLEAQAVSSLPGFAAEEAVDLYALKVTRKALDERLELWQASSAPLFALANQSQKAASQAAGIKSASELSRALEQARLVSYQTGALINAALDAQALQQDLLASGWIKLKHWYAISATSVGALMSFKLFTVNDSRVTIGGLSFVVFTVVLALVISRLVRRSLRKLGKHRPDFSPSSLYTLGRISHYTLMALGVMWGLSSIGLDFTKFALFASALGIGIGFGLQAMISNFVAGLIILFEKSLKVGDFVELASGVVGEVLEINVRSTVVCTNDNIDIVVPNSEFVNGRVTNWTLREVRRRIRIPFGVAYGSDKELVRKAGLEAAASVEYTLPSTSGYNTSVWLVEFGDSSLNFELVVWLTRNAVKVPGRVHAAYNWALETALAKYGLEIPFPQRDLHVRSWTPMVPMQSIDEPSDNT